MNYRDDFPIFKSRDKFHYMDSGATSQKPKVVLDSLVEYYSNYNGNAGRGSHYLAIKSEELIEEARKSVAKFIGVRNPNNIIFTKNATESLNIIAYCYGLEFLKSGDEVIIPLSNHHANLVTWQYVAKKTGALLRYVELDENGDMDMEQYESILNNNTKIVAFSGVVNATGVVNPSKKIIELAHKYKAITVLDAAQSIVHFRQDAIEIDCDFMVFSGHKMFSDFGVGILYGKSELLEKMPPFLYGGEMIEYVEQQSSTFQHAPYKYEGGTMNAAAIHSLKVAIDYIEKIGYDNIEKIISDLERYAIKRLKELEFVTLYNENAREKAGIVSFNVRGVHSHDTAHILNEFGVMIRSGHHCTQPLMKFMSVPSSCRASFGVYNDYSDIDAMIDGLRKVEEIFLK